MVLRVVDVAYHRQRPRPTAKDARSWTFWRSTSSTWWPCCDVRKSTRVRKAHVVVVLLFAQVRMLVLGLIQVEVV